LNGNKKSKDIALKAKLGEDEHALDLMTNACHAMMVASREDADVRVLISFLTFLATWMHSYPPAVHHFLSEGANFSFLLEQMSQTTAVDPTIQGLAAFVLGICFEFNDDSIPSLSRTSIQSIVINRLGADQYLNRLNRLRESQHFKQCSYEDEFEASSSPVPELFFDPMFIDLFKSSFESMQKTVVSPKALKQKQQEKEESQQQENVISSYKKVIAEQDAEMAKLRQRLAAMEVSQAPVAANPAESGSQDGRMKELEETVGQLQAEVVEWKGKYETTRQEMEDLLVCLAEQDMEVAKLKERLMAHGETFDEGLEDDEEDEEQAGGEAVAVQ
jgi:hypothetical protein